jgi:hypothetical protein
MRPEHVTKMERISIADYLFALPFSFGLFAIAWALLAPGHLYYCWDDAAPFLVSWYPPFIHPWANSTDGNLVDRYIAPVWVVYVVWLSFVAGAFVLPAVFAWRGGRQKRGYGIA